MPSSEVTDHCVTIHHARFRKTKSTPHECPDAPADPEAYTGERIIIGTYRDGSEVKLPDLDWINNTHSDGPIEGNYDFF